jgi:hypothetical protein
MRTRWTDRWENANANANIIGQAVVASWWPGLYHFVSTIHADSTSALRRLTESIATGKPYEEVLSAPEAYVTNIYRCSKVGFVRGSQWDRPLFQREYNNLSEAQKGHDLALVLLEHGDWSALRALSQL